MINRPIYRKSNLMTILDQMNLLKSHNTLQHGKNLKLKIWQIELEDNYCQKMKTLIQKN